VLENGSVIEGKAEKNSLELTTGANPHRRLLVLEHRLPLGYHHFEVERVGAAMPLIIVPPRCWLPRMLEDNAKVWGVAAQLYLIHTDSNWGIGDFSDLKRLIELAAGWGAHLVGLNPLHAMFLDDPNQVSPYSPASRLFLNIFYIDITIVPEFAASPQMRAMTESRPFQAALEKARMATLLDYESVAKLKLDALRILFRTFQQLATPERRGDFETFVQDHDPALKQFCVFQALRMAQAVRDVTATDWRQWPKEFRAADSAAVQRFAADNSDEIEFLCWTLWIAELQLAEAAASAKRCGMAIGLYCDLAVGANAAGAESWGHPQTVVSRARAGAPPDLLNTSGQDWGLPPFDPRVLRETGYAAFIELVQANMRHAGALRIDHVVGLQHLYWVPEGRPPSAGAYVTYPFDDLTGILALESWRNQCLVVGEDLGTVPMGFRERAAALGIFSYKVVYFEQDTESGAFLPPEKYPSLALATVGSHDLATIDGWSEARDVELREANHLYSDPAEGQRQRLRRSEEKRRLLEALEKQRLDPGDGSDSGRLSRAVHTFLGRSGAAIAMVQMENLINDRMQVNLPGTTTQYPNWRQRLIMSLETIATDSQIESIIQSVSVGRREAENRITTKE
jgi:4-alpha-glucanotransferase